MDEFEKALDDALGEAWRRGFSNCDPRIEAVKRAHVLSLHRAALEDAVKVPDGMLDRVKAASQRISDGHALRRIPADPTDVDLVLAEVQLWLEGKPAPFWIDAARSKT